MSRKEKDSVPMQRVRTRKGRQDLPDLSINPEVNRLPIKEIAQRIQTMAIEHSSLFEHELRALKLRMVDIAQLFEYLTRDSPQLETIQKIIEGGIHQPLSALYEHVVQVAEMRKAEQQASDTNVQHETFVRGLLAEQDTHFAQMCHVLHEEVRQLQEIVAEDTQQRKNASDALAGLNHQLAEAQQLVQQAVVASNALQHLLRKTSSDIREDQLPDTEIFVRSRMIDQHRRHYQDLVTSHATVQKQYAIGLQKFDMAIKSLRQWENTWNQRTLAVARMGLLFERAGINPYQMLGVDREKLFTLPGHEERQELYRHLPPLFPELKDVISAQQFSELDDIFLKLDEAAKARQQPAPPPASSTPTMSPIPAPSIELKGLHLVVCSYYVIGHAFGHDALYEQLEKQKLMCGVTALAWQDGLREAVRRGLLESGLGSGKDRQGFPKVVRLSSGARKTVEACGWLKHLPSDFATRLKK